MTDKPIELRPAWRNYWPLLTLAVLFLLAALGAALAAITDEATQTGEAAPMLILALACLGFAAYRRFCWKFTVDGKRVSRHKGLIARNQQGVRIQDLRSVEMEQGVFQRIFGIGDVAFYSAGSASAEVKFFGIKDPAGWRDKIDDMMDALKQ